MMQDANVYKLFKKQEFFFFPISASVTWALGPVKWYLCVCHLITFRDRKMKNVLVTALAKSKSDHISSLLNSFFSFFSRNLQTDKRHIYKQGILSHRAKLLANSSYHTEGVKLEADSEIRALGCLEVVKSKVVIQQLQEQLKFMKRVPNPYERLLSIYNFKCEVPWFGTNILKIILLPTY